EERAMEQLGRGLAAAGSGRPERRAAQGRRPHRGVLGHPGWHRGFLAQLRQIQGHGRAVPGHRPGDRGPGSTFEPRYAIVTASDSGIGKATAVALAQRGMDIGITWYTDSEGAEATAKEVRSHGRKAHAAQLDTTSPPKCGAVIDRLAEDLGGLDVFVNNAGTGGSELLVDLDYDEWRRIMCADLDGAFVCLGQAARRVGKAG